MRFNKYSMSIIRWFTVIDIRKNSYKKNQKEKNPSRKMFVMKNRQNPQVLAETFRCPLKRQSKIYQKM